MTRLPKQGEPPVEIHGPNDSKAFLKKCSSGRDWHLRKEGIKDHSRFGNAAHIREDIEHFLITGSLPRGEMF
jgi:hypothetical protein